MTRSVVSRNDFVGDPTGWAVRPAWKARDPTGNERNGGGGTTAGADVSELVRISALEELARMVEHARRPYQVRFSAGPAGDRDERTTDYESGLELPGLSVHPLHPQPWWTRPLVDWLARQLCSYSHFADSDRSGCVLAGEVVTHGPDDEPVLADWTPMARLSESVLREAGQVYRDRFNPGQLAP